MRKSFVFMLLVSLVMWAGPVKGAALRDNHFNLELNRIEENTGLGSARTEGVEALFQQDEMEKLQIANKENAAQAERYNHELFLSNYVVDETVQVREFFQEVKVAVGKEVAVEGGLPWLDYFVSIVILIVIGTILSVRQKETDEQY
jgi:hypothetical protein